jgi:hypothetical protein
MERIGTPGEGREPQAAKKFINESADVVEEMVQGSYPRPFLQEKCKRTCRRWPARQDSAPCCPQRHGQTRLDLDRS